MERRWDRWTSALFLGAALALVAGAVITVASWRRSVEDATRRDAAAADELRQVVGDALTRITSSLAGAAAVVDADGSVDHDRFANYSTSVTGSTGLAALALNLVLRADERVEWERATGRAIVELAAGDFVRAGDRAQYWVVTDVVPRRPSNDRLIGWDIGAEPTRASAAEAAVATGRVTVSEPITSQPDNVQSVYIVAPLYRPDTLLAAPDARVPVGFISSVVRGPTIATAIAERLDGVGYRIVDLESGLELLSDGPLGHIGARIEADVAGRTWSIAVDDGRRSSTGRTLVLGASTVLAAALFLALGLARRRRVDREAGALAASAALDELTDLLALAADPDDVLAAVERSAPVLLGVENVVARRLDAGAAAPQGGNDRFVVRGLAEPVGVVAVGRRVEERSPSVTLDTIAELCHQALVRIELSAMEHRLIDDLQSRIRRIASDPRGIDVAVAYRPAQHGISMGGDWYDVVVGLDGATRVVVGDVAGHGVQAVADMLEMRSSTRALLAGSLAIEEVVERVDRLTDAGGTATMVVAEFLPDEVRYVAAGHPPPLIVGGAGAVRILEEGRSPLLGLAEPTRRVAAVAPFGPDDVLVLYTDGLVEAPPMPIDDAIDALGRRLQIARSADRSLDGLLSVALEDTPERDDVALVLVRRRGVVPAPHELDRAPRSTFAPAGRTE